MSEKIIPRVEGTRITQEQAKLLVEWFQEMHPQDYVRWLDVEARIGNLLEEFELTRTILTFLRSRYDGGEGYERAMAFASMREIVVALTKEQRNTETNRND